MKAVEKIVEQKSCSLKIFQKRGSGVRFEIFKKNSTIPENFWVLHSHEQKTVTSKKDYEKAAYQLGVELSDFIKVIEEL